MEEDSDFPDLSAMRKPDWLRIRLPSAGDYSHIKNHLKKYKLNTICESGSCPNIGECWTAKTATFMILGNVCTRNCSFCAVNYGIPSSPDTQEPENLSQAIKQLGIKHCVITSVTRDDLSDGGSGHWYNCILSIRSLNPSTSIETLIPDFEGNQESLNLVFSAFPDILAHNLESVERLCAGIRTKANYRKSLRVIELAARYGLTAKSGIMLGLGETAVEVCNTMDDLLNAGCSILTIGQYLKPSKINTPVIRYLNPTEFDEFKQIALSKGFKYAESGPLVRSSYHASNHVQKTDN